MKLELIRDIYTDTSTSGRLYLEGKFFCFTLEDTARPVWVKIPGKTCIPEGVYPVIKSFSPRFGKILPELLNVYNFTNIRMHAGNRPEDTDGCILLGLSRAKDSVYRSVEAVESLIDYIKQAQSTELHITHVTS
jgi:hypothetical protein